MSDYLTESAMQVADDSEVFHSEKDAFSKQISEISKQGYQSLKDNDLEGAEEYFKQVLSLEDNNNYALVGLGDIKRKQSMFKDAIGYYLRCLSSHPGNNYALFGLADCYKSLNQYYKAIEVWKQYLTHDDRNITVLTRVADVYRKIRDFKNSKQVYLKVLDMESDNAYALIGLGHLHYDFQEYRDALFYWMKMLEINAGAADIRVFTSIGNCYRKLKEFDKGIYYFERALKMDDSNFYALFGLADCYRGMDQPFRSIEYWNKILEIDPENKVILTRMGDAYRNTGDYEAAEKCYERAMDISFDIYAVLGLALICKGKGNYTEAIKRLERLVQEDPKNCRPYIDMADCYVKMGQKPKAIEVLKQYQRFETRNQTINEMIESLQSS